MKSGKVRGPVILSEAEGSLFMALDPSAALRMTTYPVAELAEATALRMTLLSLFQFSTL
jgi:hypothetical protein